MDLLFDITSPQKLPLAAIIPAYQPDNRILDIAKILLASFGKVIIVNDGSHADKKEIFDALHENGCTVLTHQQNQGKGVALKTAFTFLLSNSDQQIKGSITIDADGQHQLSDVLRVAQEFLNNPEYLALGIRHFDLTVPWRSRFGNRITRWLFKNLYGLTLNDTQTGLRAIPQQLLEPLTRLKHSRYEYELSMLIFAAKNNINIREIVIETIYENNNASSHFRPLVDSWRIYRVLLGSFF
jgi:glycosyltransferase involved in cell wall biosynthesis